VWISWIFQENIKTVSPSSGPPSFGRTRHIDVQIDRADVGLVLDVNHDMSKTRLSKDGAVVAGSKMKTLKGDLERIAATKGEGGTYHSPRP
jgi:hypothetical protein